jgi:hypothetical protein
MARLERAAVLRHQANLGEGVEDVAFEAGTELTVLKEWADRVLVKDASGRMYNVPKEWLEL